VPAVARTTSLGETRTFIPSNDMGLGPAQAAFSPAQFGVFGVKKGTGAKMGKE